MPAFGRGFFVRCARPKGLRAPWNPGGGAPCTARLTSASGGPAGASRRAGCRGKAPPTPCRQAWVAPVASRGRVLALRGCGPHQPLDPPFTRKTRQRPAQGRRGTVGWMGVKARAATAQQLGLDAQERPQRSGLVAGVLFPQPPATWRTPPEGRRKALLPLIFASEVWGFRGRHAPQRSGLERNRPSEAQGGPFVYPGFRSEHDKRSLRKCALASLRGLERRHPVGASRGFTR